MIYLIGSLRNANIPSIAAHLRGAGHHVFDDWFAAGPEADDKWQEYEIGRGRTFTEALEGEAAQNVFHFDIDHLARCTSAVLVLPAGKSGHMELGYVLGRGKPGFILLAGQPERYDVMYKLASAVCSSVDELLERMHQHGAH